MDVCVQSSRIPLSFSRYDQPEQVERPFRYPIDSTCCPRAAAILRPRYGKIDATCFGLFLRFIAYFHSIFTYFRSAKQAAGVLVNRSGK
jgi:hypothetical protein